jgi:AcrR family transcriptional regulator
MNFNPIPKKAVGKVKKSSATNNTTETRQRILVEAARMFRYQGFATTSLREIAQAVGIKAGSIYYHFDSKEQILDEVLHLGMKNVADGVRERVDALPGDATWRDRITVAIRCHLMIALHHGDFTSANFRLYAYLPAEAKDRQRAIRRSYADYWDRLFEGARQAGELRSDVSIGVIRLFIVGALNWTIDWYDPKRGSFESLCDQMVKLVFEGIAESASEGSGVRSP